MTLFGVSVGKHKAHNRFPHILWRYITPCYLNCITWEPGQPKVYKWLWWYVSISTTKNMLTARS